MTAGISDQGLAAGANALINLALARWLSAAEYGVFCLGFTVFLMGAGIHNSLILEPVSVLGASRFARGIQVYLRNVFFGQLALSLLLAALLAAGAMVLPISAAATTALFGAAIVAPLTLTLWYLRRIQYLLGNAPKAAQASALYAVALILLFAIAKSGGKLTVTAGFALMAAAAGTGCALSLRLALVRGGDPSMPSVARAHWQFGKWFVAAPLLSVGTNHIQLLVAAACLGMAGTGALRAMLNFAMPLVQLVTALSNLALPSLARTYVKDPKQFAASARRLVLAYGAGGFVYLIVLCAFGRRLENLVYGGKFSASTGSLPILGLWMLAVCISNALGIVLRARQNLRACFLALLTASAFGFLSAQPLIRAYGVMGAALSMAGSYAVSVIVQGAAYYRERRFPNAPLFQKSAG